MPLTPLHYPIAFIVYLASKKNLDLPVLVVSSMLPDIEIPVVWLLSNGSYDRLILHSFLGSIVFGLPLTIFLLYPLYKMFFSKILNSRTVFSQHRSMKILVISCLIGLVSHVIVDALHHPYNPLFWPFSPLSFGGIILFGNLILASNLTYMVFTVLLVSIFIYAVLNGKNLILQLFIR